MKKMRYIYLLIIILSIVSCTKPKQQELTPWGTPLEADGSIAADSASAGITLDDIISQGEMIVLTVSGPTTYYDYHGQGMGLHYLLCERLAQRLGVKLRVELCKDSVELGERLVRGEGDIVACPVKIPGTTVVGPQWAVAESNTSLAENIRSWYKPEMLTEIDKQMKQLLANGGVTRHVYAPMINRQKGLISRWDALFQKHAPTARLDWRLLAAQCYQESCFDPKAHSFAGACGLMQIMPATAAHLGLPMGDIYKPEPNIAAAARYMNELMNAFREVPTNQDRICFALAAYNGGKNHITDAMSLARKHGGNPHSWRDVQPYVLRLAQPEYYRDPVVKYGYMRGSETSNYVDRIMSRWADYGGRIGRYAPSIGPSSYTGPSTQPKSVGSCVPHPSKRKNKYSQQ